MRDHWICLDETNSKKGPKTLLTLIIDTDENSISIGKSYMAECFMDVQPPKKDILSKVFRANFSCCLLNSPPPTSLTKKTSACWVKWSLEVFWCDVVLASCGAGLWRIVVFTGLMAVLIAPTWRLLTSSSRRGPWRWQFLSMLTFTTDIYNFFTTGLILRLWMSMTFTPFISM